MVQNIIYPCAVPYIVEMLHIVEKSSLFCFWVECSVNISLVKLINQAYNILMIFFLVFFFNYWENIDISNNTLEFIYTTLHCINICFIYFEGLLLYMHTFWIMMDSLFYLDAMSPLIFLVMKSSLVLKQPLQLSSDYFL